ncbi:MAG: chromosomal replication initiator protein DnaA [Vampirovibrionales bacterium]|nr:chromosomal replication initiator protein DnaA [Vampirovibrionales bacterium]
MSKPYSKIDARKPLLSSDKKKLPRSPQFVGENLLLTNENDLIDDTGVIETIETVSQANQDSQSLWENVLTCLRAKISKPSYEMWIRHLQFRGVESNRVLLAVNNEYARDHILKKHRALLTEAFSSRLERMVIIQIDVDESIPDPALEAPTSADGQGGFKQLDEDSHAKEADALSRAKSPKKQAVWTPKTLQGNLNPKYTFDQFVVGQGNRFCHAAAVAVAKSPAEQYNPFFIYGGVGLGKTHLMQAIAHYAHQNHPEMIVRYVTAEQFTNELIASLMNKTQKAFRDRYRKIDILIIDDIQFLEGKERTQEEVFHTFNALHQAGKQIILSSDRAPRYIAQLTERLKSRFESGLMADIQPADYETRLAILKNKVKRDHFQVPDEVLQLIADSHPNNIRELEGGLNKVTAFSMLTKTILDLESAKQILGTGQAGIAQISKDRMIEIVAAYYHLSADDLKSPSRAKDVSHARQVAIYILRSLTEASFPKIGDLLGGRKHTTILYAYEKMKEQLDRHPSLAQQIQEITTRVKSPQ